MIEMIISAAVSGLIGYAMPQPKCIGDLFKFLVEKFLKNQK